MRGVSLLALPDQGLGPIGVNLSWGGGFVDGAAFSSPGPLGHAGERRVGEVEREALGEKGRAGYGAGEIVEDAPERDRAAPGAGRGETGAPIFIEGRFNSISKATSSTT